MAICVILYLLLVLIFVGQTSSRLHYILRESKEQTKALKELNQMIEQNGKAAGAIGANVATKTETTNALLSQLIRAYGHEPEA